MTWLVGYVSSNTEKGFQEDMSDIGVEVWYPVAKRWTKPKRKKHAIETERPAFGRYLFVRMPIEGSVWYDIKHHRNFHFFLRMNGEYLMVRQPEMDRMKSQEDWSDNLDKEKSPFVVNDQIRVKLGAFEGVLGRVVRVYKNRIDVEVGKTVLRVGLSFLEKISHNHSCRMDPGAPAEPAV